MCSKVLSRYLYYSYCNYSLPKHRTFCVVCSCRYFTRLICRHVWLLFFYLISNMHNTWKWNIINIHTITINLDCCKVLLALWWFLIMRLQTIILVLGRILTASLDERAANEECVPLQLVNRPWRWYFQIWEYNVSKKRT